ncbi:MAG: LuxR C-terminal-related transcriptional regulator [Thermoleophilia bacterium]
MDTAVASVPMSESDKPELAGRDNECAQIQGFLAGVRVRHGGGCRVWGPPGCGVSALLAHVEAAVTGMHVLSVTAVEGEAGLPFSGLASLLESRATYGDHATGSTQRVLRQIMAASDPVGEIDAITANTLELLRQWTERSPVLLVIDDAELLDGESAEVVSRLGRLTRADAVGIIVGSHRRTSFYSWGTLATDVPVAPLDDLVMADLARPHNLPDAVARQVLTIVSGNPLALEAVIAGMTPDERVGAGTLRDPFPVGGSLLERCVRGIEHAGERATWVLALAACATEVGDRQRLTEVLFETGVSDVDVWAAAETGLVGVERGRPLVTSALSRTLILAAVTPAVRRSAHRALRAAAGADATAIVLHRAAASLGSDEALASDLCALARREAAERRWTAAARHMADAGRCSPGGPAAAARLVAAADLAMAAGRPRWAINLAREAAGTAPPAFSEQAWLIAARAELFTGSLPAARALLLNVESTDPDATAERLAIAAYVAVLTDDLTAAFAVSRQAVMAAERGGSDVSRAATVATLAYVNAVAGELREARRLFERARTLMRQIAPGPEEAQYRWMLALTAAHVEDISSANDLVQSSLTAMRGVPGGSELPRYVSGLVGVLRGRWVAAEASLAAAEAAARVQGADLLRLLVMTLQARLLALTGQEDAFQRVVAEADRLVATSGASALSMRFAAARGALELSRGRPAEARRILEPLARRRGTFATQSPLLGQWQIDLVEALLREGRRDEAIVHIRFLAETAAISGSAWAHAGLEHCRGLLHGPDAERHFGVALRAHEQLADPYALARTRLAFGQWLRRRRRRADAIQMLESSRATFARLGAMLWVARVEEEIAAAGRRTRRRFTEADRLTPREEQVASAVRAGASNREIAANLHLSVKTVERHLSSIYRKRGVRSRGALVALLDSPESGTAD